MLRRGGVVTVEVTRPEVLNAIDGPMCQYLYDCTSEWNRDPSLRCIVMKGNGKVFSAGGDIKASFSLFKNNPGNYLQVLDRYVLTEYQAYYELSQISKPTLAIFNGLVMGGGTSLGIHKKLRVATDATLFSMPESKVGLFCDVGAAHYFSRLRNNLGLYFGIFAVRLSGTEMVNAGLADYFVQNRHIPQMLAEIEKAGRN